MTKICIKKRQLFYVLLIICITLNFNVLNFIPSSLKASIGNSTLRTSAINGYASEFYVNWGDTYIDEGYDIALDTSGNIYIVGYTKGYYAGPSDCFIVKYDCSGVLLMNTTWGHSNDDDIGYGIALDVLGNIYITGSTNSSGAGKYDAFIAKYNSTGVQQWNTTWGGINDEYGYEIALDPLGNIYITGYTTSFGPGDSDAFIAKFNSTGHLKIDNIWGGSQNEFGHSIALDALGNIFITGYTYSYGAGGSDAFVVKFNSTGHLNMSTMWGGSGYDRGYGITLDDAGNVYITGREVSFGEGFYDVFIAKFDNAGNSILNITWGGDDIDFGRDITLDPSGNIYIAGNTDSYGAGHYDALILKFDNAGNILTINTWGGFGDDEGFGIALDASGNIYITGTSRSFEALHSDALLVKYFFSSGNTGAISGFNLFFFVGLIGLILIILIKKKFK